MFRDSRINTIYEGTSQIHVRIATGGIIAGMAGEGNFKKYLNDLNNDILNPSKYLLEQYKMLEESIETLRSLNENNKKEKLSENLMIQMGRYICSLLYERSLTKLKDIEVLSRWTDDAKAYVIDSTAISLACHYKIQNFTLQDSYISQLSLQSL